nr:hypothetical protein BaRGS_018452 [Batillaria attramentaria]
MHNSWDENYQRGYEWWLMVEAKMMLRQMLDASGLNHTRIVAADGNWNVATDVLKDPDLAAAVDYIGHV